MNASGLTRLHRFRRLPGFTAALVTFCLVVIMGLGATAAVAKWSQAASIGIPISVGITVPQCTVAATHTELYVTWTQEPGTPVKVETVKYNPGGQDNGTVGFQSTGPDANGLVTLTLVIEDLDLNNDKFRVNLTIRFTDGTTKVVTIKERSGSNVPECVAA